MKMLLQLDGNNSCVIIAIIFGLLPTEAKTEDFQYSISQCLEPKTNPWTGFNVSVDKQSRNSVAKFWCLSEEYDYLNLHQTNNNNNDPDERSVELLCDSISKKWIGSLPLCFPTCIPPMGNNLEIELNQLPVGKDRYLMGTKAMFDCKDGHIFMLNDSSISRCGENGRFNRHPECVATCDANEILAHKSPEMKMTFDQNKSSLKDRYLAGTEVKFTCLESSPYIQGSSQTAICKTNGSWEILNSNPLINLTCEPSCPGFSELNTIGLSITSELPPLPDGRYPLGKVQFNCADPHHNLIGNSHLSCIRKQQSAEWNGALPYCETSCFALHLTSLTSVQMTVSFDPPVLSGHSKSYMLNSRHGTNTTATFKCDNVDSNNNEVLYELVGDSKLTCQNGKWSSSQLPKCVATCDDRPVLQMNDAGNRVNVSFSREESSLFSGRYLAGTEAIFSCFDSRFQLRGNSSSNCDDNGSWTVLTPPICVPTCEDFSSTSSAGVNVIYNTPEDLTSNPSPEGRYPLNTTATFTCADANYALIGNSSLVCKENHLMTLWDGNPPLCVKTCPKIELSTSIEVTYYDGHVGYVASTTSGRGHLNGTMALFNCKDSGFVLMGSEKVYCLNDGSWNDYSDIQCVSTCGEPHLSKDFSSTDIISSPSFTLSAQINSSGRYPVNTTVMYQCIKDGIHLKEKRILQCLPSGEWNDTILLCNSDSNSMANKELIEYSVGLIIVSCICIILFIILVFCTLVILYIRHVRRTSPRSKWPSKKWLEFKRNNSQYETNETLSANDCEEQQRQCLVNRNSRCFTTPDGTDPAGYLVPIGPLNHNDNSIIDASPITDSVGYLAPILTPVNMNSAAYFAAVTQAISFRSLTNLAPTSLHQVNNNGSRANYALRPTASSRSLTDVAGYQIPIPGSSLEENRRTLSTPLNYGKNWDYHTYEEVL